MLIQIDYEIKRYSISKQNPIDTLFFGGGTPSSVEAKYYKPIFDKLSPLFADGIEITTEANPNSATKEWQSKMKELGVNRISFGVQSFDNDKLKLLGRNHSKDTAIKAIEVASKLYTNISIDLIYNVAGDTKSSLKNDIDIALSYPINHLSGYSLTLEENTKFENTDMSLESQDIAEFFISKINERLPQYEISNFGTYKSKHNFGYWQGEEYVGIGAGAVGYKGTTRYYPTSNVDSYIQNPLNIQEEKLSKNDLHTEKIFLGLRSEVGIDIKTLSKNEQERAKILLDENKLEQKQNLLINKNYLIADEISLFLLS
jgi:oxygen-independent coproporphyrinogen-3 oxidase